MHWAPVITPVFQDAVDSGNVGSSCSECYCKDLENVFGNPRCESTKNRSVRDSLNFSYLFEGEKKYNALINIDFKLNEANQENIGTMGFAELLTRLIFLFSSIILHFC
jgi:hypothetical protein